MPINIYVDTVFSGSDGSIPSPWWNSGYGVGIADCSTLGILGWDGATQCLQDGGVSVGFTNQDVLTIYAAMYFNTGNQASAVMSIFNSVGVWTNRFTHTTLNLEPDNTLSIYCGKLVCNTFLPLQGFQWNFIQINLGYGISPGSTLLCTASLVINGITQAFGTVDSGISMFYCPDGLADCNQIELHSPGYGWAWSYIQVRDFTAAMGLPPGTPATFPYPVTNPPGPTARVSHLAIDAAEQSDDPYARVTQAAIEAMEQIGGAQNARVSHIVIELMLAAQMQNWTGIWGWAKSGDSARGSNAVGMY